MLKPWGKEKVSPDTLVYLPNKLLHIEFKVGKNKQSKEQILCEKHINTFDYCSYHVAYSADEAKDIVTKTLQ